jgi:hypothetical protein
MNFGQMRRDNQHKAQLSMYENTNYSFERRTTKTLILDIEDDATTAPLCTATDFTVNLFEPLIIDKLSDIYLDNFSTFNSLLCDTNDRSSFSVSINEFNVDTNTASTNSNQTMYNNIIIPNEHNDIDNIHSCVIHKGKKMNYVCSINPGRITSLKGKITDLAGNSMFSVASKVGKIYSISLTTGLTSDVPVETSFTMTVGGAALAFKTVVHATEKSTLIYFNSDNSTVTGDLGTVTSTISAAGSGLHTLTPDDSTKRSGDYPRCTAEFIISARE